MYGAGMIEVAKSVSRGKPWPFTATADWVGGTCNDPPDCDLKVRGVLIAENGRLVMTSHRAAAIIAQAIEDAHDAGYDKGADAMLSDDMPLLTLPEPRVRYRIVGRLEKVED